MTTDAKVDEARTREPKRVAVLGSGTGSTARHLIQGGLKKGSSYTVALIISTSVSAGINTVASENAVTLLVLDRSLSVNEWTDRLLGALFSEKIDIVVLAGFMRLLPEVVIDAMQGRVLNIHPALLPKHGGAGMYGRRVHEAVIRSGDRESGATVHLVDAEYDHGQIFRQVKLDVREGETAQELELRVKEAESVLYPMAIEEYAAELSFHVGNW